MQPWMYAVIAAAIAIVLVIVIVIIVKSNKKDKEQGEGADGEAACAATKNEQPAQPAQEPPAAAKSEEDDEQAEEEEEGGEVEVETPDADDKGKKTVKTYHISKRKSDGMWQIKLAGGKKAIKLFRTQQEAIDYCKTLAEKQDANVTVHKKDGSFRKQNY